MIRRQTRRITPLVFVVLAGLPINAYPGALPDRLVAYVAQRYGDAAKRRLLDWDDLMSSYLHASTTAKQSLANDFFNRIPWQSDLKHWGRKDYWATPAEMLATFGGDCEDYSIAKYFTLAEMGTPRDRLLITYVRAPRLKQSHMVLAYYPTPGADPLILDNLSNAIKLGSQRSDLIPVYSFNADGLWMAVQRGRGRKVGGPTRLNLWRDLTRRMRLEGYAAKGNS